MVIPVLIILTGKGKDAIKDFNPSEGDKKSSGRERVNYKGKSHHDDDKAGNNDGSNSADQGGISRGQSSDQSSQCVSGEDAIVSCDIVAFQNLVNSGKNALGQTP